MQENNSVPMANSSQTTEVQPVLTDNGQKPKTNNFLVILLSILLFSSVSIAGFFAYQTQKLVKELTVLKTQEKIVAVATTEPTTEPVATSSSEVDPTADWKTYENTNAKIFLKYPSSINEILGTESGVSGPNIGTSNFVQTFADKSTIVQNSDSGFDGFSVYEIESSSLNMSFDQYLNKELEAVKASPRGLTDTSIAKLKIGNQQFSYIDSEVNIRRYFILSPDKLRIVIFSRVNRSSDFIMTFDQILSTFKFTN